MSTKAPLHAKTGLSKITLIDAVANYCKHHYEWPENWIGSNDVQQRTIDMVIKIGMLPDGDDNLYTAAHEIGMRRDNMTG